MSNSRQPETAPVIPESMHRGLTIERIRFVAAAKPGESALFEFSRPRKCTAIRETVEPAAFTVPPRNMAPTEELFLVRVRQPDAWTKLSDLLMGAKGSPEGSDAVSLRREKVRAAWKPGIALVHGAGPDAEEAIQAIISFAFLEGELRTLEGKLEAHQDTAAADVPRAYRMDRGHRENRDHFGDMIEYFSAMRLTFSRLEPLLNAGPRSLPRRSRQWVVRLAEKADVDARLESFSDGLEVCEDLYEGASDRLVDHRWYRTGYILELMIVLLLIGEVMLMITEIVLHIQSLEE